MDPPPALADQTHSCHCGWRNLLFDILGESDPGEQEVIAPFKEALAKLDSNKDGKLSKDEIVDPKVKARFDEYLDLDDTGFLEEHDWKQFQERRLGENAIRAYQLGEKAILPIRTRCGRTRGCCRMCPLRWYTEAMLYTVKEGGIFVSYDIKTGEIRKQARLEGALGDYYASPIAADGRIYTVSEEGKAVVIEPGADWKVIRVNDLKDGCKATFAPAGDKMYVRTYGMLYCFARKD